MRFVGLNKESLTSQMAIYWISPSQYIEGILSGIFLGTLFIFINELSQKFHWERFGFGRLILVKSLAYAIGFSVVFFIIYLIVDALGYYPDDVFSSFQLSIEIILLFLMIMMFLVFQIVMLNYIIETNRKIGDFNVTSFITGKYRDPILENRLFMFLDLKSSTSIAEQLGDVSYSQLLRDCYRDFNYTLKAYESLDIYQYVGDEVVVTSKWEGPQSPVRMIDLYFRFSGILKSRSKHYQSTYGVVPFFKAGIHGGLVSVTEIGTIRRDIAFHGDVLNTTSRIQDLCNQLGQVLLVSATILKENGSIKGYKKQAMGSFQLRGKEDAVEIFAII